MSPIKLGLEGQPQILDIRQGYNSLDLKEEITNSLRSQPPSIPSLLLWDDQGQKLFDRLSQNPSYYPFHSEMDVLSQYGSSIGGSMPADGVLLELGCGAIHKTKLILSGFRKQQKPVQYFALDVSYEGLEASLVELRRSFEDCPFITITGLLGTYNDSVTWLGGFKSLRKYRSVTVLWLGNSIGNMDSQEQASFFLERFSTACQHAQLACRFVVSTDICQKDAKVLEAYDAQGPELRDFLLNALEAANLALGYKAFSTDDWTLSSWLDNYERTLHFYVTAKHDLLVPLLSSANGSKTVAIRKGERIHIVASGKWSEGAMGSICERAGFQIQQRWKDDAGDYCVFLLA
ncbi:histidine-specific methyltransferase [Xylariaceae sp. AK1471]|nr:histidine-specific methyltransferase [Xylariaceae sp. AK1471]